MSPTHAGTRADTRPGSDAAPRSASSSIGAPRHPRLSESLLSDSRDSGATRGFKHASRSSTSHDSAPRPSDTPSAARR
jgi:hypothetical protein